MKQQEAIAESINHLKAGGIILFPSDSIWGLSCDASNPTAIEKLIKLKGREQNKSFIVLVNSDRMVNQCVKDIPSVVWDMIDLADTPLTLVLDGGQFVAPKVINEDGTIAIRMVKEGEVFDLLRKFNRPIVSTSANFSGEPTPMQFSEISDEIKEKTDYVYPLLQNHKKIASPSKILRIESNGGVKILRK